MAERSTHQMIERQGDETRVVIVGGGIGGLMLATRLGRRFRQDQSVGVYLIDCAPVHVWKPMLHTFAAGTANAHEDGVPFLAQARRSGFTFLPGEFHAIDRADRTIGIRMTDLGDGEAETASVPYDVAVIAIGGGANDFGTPGVKEHCHSIDSLSGAEALNKEIRKQIVRSAVRDGDIEIAIVGGGATGVEFAAETARLVEIGAAYSGVDLERRLKLLLLDAGDRILGAFPEELAERVSSTLRGLGVAIRTGVRVARADAQGFVLADGERLDAAIKVWAAGVKAPDVLSEAIDLERSRAGQIVVSSTLQSTSDPAIFAIGDCASLTPQGSERPLPPTGQVARQQADHLAVAIPAYLRGDALRDFVYRDMGSLVSLSQYGAYGALAGQGVLPTLAIRGWFAQRAHELFYRMHQFGLYGPIRGAIVMARDGLDSLVKPPARLD